MHVWQPSQLQKAATEINGPLQIMNACGAVLSTTNQVLHTFGGEGAQKHAADGQQTLQRLSACIGASSGVANALAAPAARLQQQKLQMLAVARMVSAAVSTGVVQRPNWNSPGPEWVFPAPPKYGADEAANVAAAEEFNALTEAVMAAVKQTDWAGYINILNIIGQLAVTAFAPDGGGGGDDPGGGDDDPFGRDDSFGAEDPFGGGGDPFGGTALNTAGPLDVGAGVNAAAGPALAGRALVASTAALAGAAGAAVGGAVLPMGGGVPVGPAGRKDEERRPASGIDWRLAEQDDGMFSGRDAPTENGVLT
jgi:hypothetical protein